MISPDTFLYFVREHDKETLVRLGKVDTNYASGRPRIIFDGESVPSTKAYPYLSSYTPAANDRVMLVRAGSTWVVVGDIV